MSHRSESLPFRERLTTLVAQAGRQIDSGMLSTPWVQWLLSLVGHLDQTAHQLAAKSLTAQAASIAATSMPLPALAPGLYRVSYYARITQAATTSSSLTVTISWTEGVALSLSGAAMTGNTTATVQTSTFVIRVDQASPIRYATTYASAGATPMIYRVQVVVKAMP